MGFVGFIPPPPCSWDLLWVGQTPTALHTSALEQRPRKSWTLFVGFCTVNGPPRMHIMKKPVVNLHTACAGVLSLLPGVRCIFSRSSQAFSALESSISSKTNVHRPCYQSDTPGTSGTRPSRRPKAELRQWSLCPHASTKDTASGRKTCSPVSFELPNKASKSLSHESIEILVPKKEVHGLTGFDRLYGYMASLLFPPSHVWA